MASRTFFALSILFLSLSSLPPSAFCLPSSAILDAAEILSTSGFEAMALNLELASHTFSSPAAPQQALSLTIFAPSDFAFFQIPHLPLSLLRYHLLPHAFSLHSLTSLPFGANIPTLLPGHSLTITTTTTARHHHHHRLSINNITVNPSPVFDDGRVIIFQTESFFDPYFQLPDTNPRGTNRRSGAVNTASSACVPPKKPGAKLYPSESVASGVLRSSGRSVMASLLEMQFLGLQHRPPLTLFAPPDEAVASLVRNLSDCASVLRRHLVPCRISWSDLVKLEDGSSISTFEEGFALNVTRSGGSYTVLLNSVPVVFRELYHSDWLVVHGLREALSKDPVQISAPEEENGKEYSFDGGNTVQHSHFSVFH